MEKAICQIPPGTRVLVTGATGFTGSVLTKKLVEAGLNVCAIARNSSKLGAFEGLNIEWFRGNVYDKEVVAKAADKAEYIFHVAAAFREAKICDDDYRKVHIESTKLLANAALKNPSFKRFIHVSTMGVHGHIETPPGDENSPFSPGDVYQRTKAEAELWFRDFASKNKLPFTVIRPTGIYGPGDRRLLKIFKMALWPLFPILGYGKCLYHFIHVDDLANGIIVAATHPRALGEVFLIGNADPIRLEDVARCIAESCGKKLRVVRIPVTPFFVAADICEAICRPLGIEPPIYRRRVAFYTKDRSFNTEKFRTWLGYEPRQSNEDGFRETAKWYLEHGWLK